MDNQIIKITELLDKFKQIKKKIKFYEKNGMSVPKRLYKQYKKLRYLKKNYFRKDSCRLKIIVEIINLIDELHNSLFNDKTIIILLPLEQPSEIFNISIQDLINFANLKKWKVITENTNFDPVRFISLAKKYISLGYKYFIGGSTSNEVLAWNEQIKNADVTLISPSSSAIIKNKSNNIIRLVPNDQVTATVIFSFLNSKNINSNNIGILSTNNIFGNSLVEQIQKIYNNNDQTINYVSFYDAQDINDIITKAKNLFTTFNNENQYTIIISDQEIKTILEQRQDNNNSFSILPDLVYNYFVLNSIKPEFQNKILATGYIGASTITSLDRTDYQNELYSRFGIYASTYDLNIIDTLRFFDLIVDGLYNSDEIVNRMDNYYGITGNLHFNINHDRNNDAYTVGRVRNLNNMLVWEDISYQALKDTLIKDGVILEQTLSSFPELTNVNVHIIPTIKWNVIKYTNFNGMTYYFENIIGDPFPYPVSFRLELISDNISILIPPTASTGAIVVASIIEGNNVKSVTLSGINRIMEI